MSYSVRYLSRARKELDHCLAIYSETFARQVRAWIKEIADGGDVDDPATSIRLDELSEQILDDGSGWSYSSRRWLRAEMAEKAKALLVVLKQRQPPWEPRVSTRSFTVLDTFSCQVHAFYLLDRVNKEVRFMMFDGLPGPLPRR